MKMIRVHMGARMILVVDGVPTKWLGPGRHWDWTLLADVSFLHLHTSQLVVDVTPEVAKIAPASELAVVQLRDSERAIVHQGGKPVRWLGAGRHYVLTVDPSVQIQLVDTNPDGDVTAEPLAREVKDIVAARDYVEVTVPEGAVALRYVDGVLDKILGPGRHAAWKTAREVRYATLDLRERQLAVTGQEVMTKDKMSLRLNATATWSIVDPHQVATAAQDIDQALYLALQLAARDAVGARTLDGLLVERDVVAKEILDEVRVRMEELGVKVSRVGVKDVVLPGDMKLLLNRVLEAQKQAEASVITRREEAAATRAMAQTAELLAQQPQLIRLKELEAYKELAERVGEVHVVLGDTGLKGLTLGSR